MPWGRSVFPRQTTGAPEPAPFGFPGSLKRTGLRPILDPLDIHVQRVGTADVHVRRKKEGFEALRGGAGIGKTGNTRRGKMKMLGYGRRRIAAGGGPVRAP